MYKSIFYLTKEHLDKYWNQLEPLLDAGIMTSEGEINIHQLRLLIVQGLVHVIVATHNPDEIIGAVAFELINYPNFRAANIISLGGDNLFLDEKDIKNFAEILKKGGVSRIQGWCKPAQARLLSSKLGFKLPYQMVSMDIGD